MLRYHAAFLLLYLGTAVLFSALAWLNSLHEARTALAEREWLERELGVDDVDAMVAYNEAKHRLGELRRWLLVALVLAVLYSGGLAHVVAWFEGFGYHPVVTGAAFFVGAVVTLQLFSVPFDLYDTFVIEERFEFNEQTPGLFLKDLLLGTLIAVVLTAIVAGVVLWFVAQFPTWWWVAATIFFAAFSLVMLVVYPRLIAPLFNDFVPIEAGELRSAVEEVFDRAGFSCSQIYEMDASRRSSHSNAYFIGFGRTKRVVLFDTLIDQLSIEQLQAVLAHELAHWQKAHVWKLLGASVLRVAVLLAVLWLLMGTSWLYAMFDLPEVAYAGLLVGSLWVLPLGRLLSPLENRLSLAFEYEADAFASDVMDEPEPLVGALATLASENLSNPFPHPWYAAFNHSHPPIPERIRAIRERFGVVDEGDDPPPVSVAD